MFDMQIIKQGLDFERQKDIRLNENDEYKTLKKKMQDIKNQYQNVRLYIEDEEVDNTLNTDKVKAVLKIIEIENNMNALGNRGNF